MHHEGCFLYSKDTEGLTVQEVLACRSKRLEHKWFHRNVAIFKCFRKTGSVAVKELEELVIANSKEIQKDQNLCRVLEVLQRDLILKRIYHFANNPTTRLLTFRTYPSGQENQGRKLMSALLRASGKEVIRNQAFDLAKRYMQTGGVREGILIFLISHGELDTKMAEDCLFVFKCDFEQVSQVTTHELFRKIKDAIVEQTKKGALYPYFDRGKFNDASVRVFDELGEAQYWLDFLDLGERKPEYESLQEAVINQLSVEHSKLLTKYAEEFKSPSPIRALVDKTSLVRLSDRIPLSEMKPLTEHITTRAGEQMITLRLGEVRITAPLSQYGRTWVIAANGDQRYLLIKGSKLENHTRMLTPLDVVQFTSLTEAAAELDISLA